ncbi:unnamed protein product [Pseudo-nitzschia multistriata]|uniref:C3H1-type domain-containing protein n=1 Tax=Pseudo-nitzschia multistriata TaxID=183589 RepID=A0A448ZE16_9STRA|nr:unnamed protein product [Pseudo-nitzschia multistriata]
MPAFVCEPASSNSNSGNKPAKKLSVPPDGYVCKLCHTKGHWIQQCPEKPKHKTKKKKNPNHVYRPGIDPSKEDIERARALQKLTPPMCFCRVRSRLKKVKRSFANSNAGSSSSKNNNTDDYYDNGNASHSYREPDYERSRAIGNYFFFCSKPRGDPTQCRFARPVEDHESITPRSRRVCAFFQKHGSCRKGDACAFSHETIGGGHGNETGKRKRSGECATASSDPPVTGGDSKKQKQDGKDHGSVASSSSSSSDDEAETDANKTAAAAIPTNDDSESSSSDSDSSDGDKTKVTTTVKSAQAAAIERSSDSDSDSSDSDSSDSDRGRCEDKAKATGETRTKTRLKSTSPSGSSSSSSSSESDSDSD